MRGDRGCVRCSNALCSACARSLPHRECPACREQAGQAAHVVDASWRIQLLIDSLLASTKAVPRRLPVLAGLLVIALLAPLALYGVVDPDDSAETIMAVIGLCFGLGLFGLGLWLQPLLVLPTIARTSTARAVVGALLGTGVVYLPALTVLLATLPLESLLESIEAVNQLIGLAFMMVTAISVPLGLTWQGRAVLGHAPSARGVVGAVVAHAVVAGLWMGVLTMVSILLAAFIGLGFLVDPAVAGVVGVVSGVVVWLLVLLSMGSFAAASARYSVDLERLS